VLAMRALDGKDIGGSNIEVSFFLLNFSKFYFKFKF
jgi:hypothetical protein